MIVISQSNGCLRLALIEQPWTSPSSTIFLTVDEAALRLQEWIAGNSISVLNVAGPRQSGYPAIYDVTIRGLEMAAG